MKLTQGQVRTLSKQFGRHTIYVSDPNSSVVEFSTAKLMDFAQAIADITSAANEAALLLALGSDLEYDIKELNEEAERDFFSKYPELAKAISGIGC